MEQVNGTASLPVIVSRKKKWEEAEEGSGTWTRGQECRGEVRGLEMEEDTRKEEGETLE